MAGQKYQWDRFIRPPVSRKDFPSYLSPRPSAHTPLLCNQNVFDTDPWTDEHLLSRADAAEPFHSPWKNKMREIPDKPHTSRELPGLVDDFSLNVLDWSSTNILAVALESNVYVLDASTEEHYKFCSVQGDGKSPVCSLSWAPNGKHLAVGTNSSEIAIVDHPSRTHVRSVFCLDEARVPALTWTADNNILFSGDASGNVLCYDIRAWPSIVQIYRGHTAEVCGLKWSPGGNLVASGGVYDYVHIWDIRRSCSNSRIHRTGDGHRKQYLRRIDGNKSAVKALAWCPYESSVLATGEGLSDGQINLSNVHSGHCIKTVSTGSPVSALIWSTTERELLSGHACTDNTLILWKYPQMASIAKLEEHTSTVLHLAKSPDECTVASAGAEENLLFWNVFGDPSERKKKNRSKAWHQRPLATFPGAFIR